MKSEYKFWASNQWIAVLLFFALTASMNTAQAELTNVGPVDPQNGFPAWYMDGNNLALELCKDPLNPLCLADPIIGENAFSQQIGFGAEAFWWNAGAMLEDVGPTGNGRARLVLALEAAFSNGDPSSGDQLAFGRVRVRVDGLEPNQQYTVTHPYGVEVFTSDELGQITSGQIRDDDIGCATVPCDFSLALNSNASPFLKWDSKLPIIGSDGRNYIGDPAIEHTVTGSPTGNNLFKIEGPDVGGSDVNSLETNLFSVQGKIADTVSPSFSNKTVQPSDIDANGKQTASLIANITDGLSGVDRVLADLTPIGGLPGQELTLRAGDIFNGEWFLPISTTSAGEFSLTLTAVDKAQNSKNDSITLTAATPDPPMITLLGQNPMDIPLSSAYVEPGATALDNQDGVLTQNLSIDSSLVDTNKLGTYTVSYDVKDSSENSTRATREIHVLDIPVIENPNTPPTFTSAVLNPASIEVKTGTARLIATVTDESSGVRSVMADLTPIGGAVDTEMTRVSGDKLNGVWEKTLSSDITGEFIFTVRAMDFALNTRTGSSVLQVADTTIPSSPANLTATAVSTTQVNLSWNASSDNMGVVEYRLFRNGTPVHFAATPDISYSDIGLLPSTPYTYTVVAMDGAGNISSLSAPAAVSTQSLPAIVLPVLPPPQIPLQVIPASISRINRVLAIKMRGIDVIELQKKLVMLGLYRKKITGSFKISTKKAVAAFQKMNGLPPSGVVDPTTLDLLNKIESDRYLMTGMKGSDVLNLQERLAALGLYRNKITGSFKKSTQKAVAAFQKINGLPPSGVADPTTLDLLEQIVIN